MVHLKMEVLVLAIVSLLVSTSWSATGHTQPSGSARAATDEYEYRFSDDDLLGNTLATGGDVYKIRPRAHRVLLVRPRTEFVVQLFKSVENL